jgi:hypothetical protein
MMAGVTDSPWKWSRVLARRIFPDRERAGGIWDVLYRREWDTPALRANTRHRAEFSF